MEQSHEINYNKISLRRLIIFYNKSGNALYDAAAFLIWHLIKQLEKKKSKIKSHKQQDCSYQRFLIAKCGDK